MGYIGPAVENPIPPLTRPKKAFESDLDKMMWAYEWDTICLKLRNLGCDLSAIYISCFNETERGKENK